MVTIQAPPAATRTHYRFTVDDYHRMADAGILGEDDRVELIEGVVVEMPPIGPHHSNSVIDLNGLLSARLFRHARVSPQNPVRLSQGSEPQPDFAILRGPAPGYLPSKDQLPAPADVLWLIEVADSSLEDDLGWKADLYAWYGIPELWVLDLRGQRLIVHREPTKSGYASVEILRRGASISPLALPEVAFTVDEILG